MEQVKEHSWGDSLSLLEMYFLFSRRKITKIDFTEEEMRDTCQLPEVDNFDVVEVAVQKKEAAPQVACWRGG